MNSNEEFDETELQVLREAARALPRDIPPNAAAWKNIRDRIEQTRVRELVPGASAETDSDSGVRIGLDPVQTSTAGPRDTESHTQTNTIRAGRPWMRSPRTAMLVAATLFLAVTTFVVRQQGAIEEAPGSQYAADTGRTDMTGVFARYDGAATDLVNDLQRRRPLLNPATVAVLDSALYTIDEAIRETRDALKDAPDNATIVGLLEVTYQQKLDLLRRASELSEGSFQE